MILDVQAFFLVKYGVFGGGDRTLVSNLKYEEHMEYFSLSMASNRYYDFSRYPCKFVAFCHDLDYIFTAFYLLHLRSNPKRH